MLIKCLYLISAIAVTQLTVLMSIAGALEFFGNSSSDNVGLLIISFIIACAGFVLFFVTLACHILKNCFVNKNDRIVTLHKTKLDTFLDRLFKIIAIIFTISSVCSVMAMIYFEK